MICLKNEIYMSVVIEMDFYFLFSIIICGFITTVWTAYMNMTVNRNWMNFGMHSSQVNSTTAIG